MTVIDLWEIVDCEVNVQEDPSPPVLVLQPNGDKLPCTASFDADGSLVIRVTETP